MEKKFRKLELIEVPMSELEQSALDEILAGYVCNSFLEEGGKHHCWDYYPDNLCAPANQNLHGNYCSKYAF